jgi:hypothetical protein
MALGRYLDYDPAEMKQLLTTADESVFQLPGWYMTHGWSTPLPYEGRKARRSRRSSRLSDAEEGSGDSDPTDTSIRKDRRE